MDVAYNFYVAVQELTEHRRLFNAQLHETLANQKNNYLQSSPVVLYAPTRGLSTRAKETIYRWGLLLFFSLLFEDVWLSMHLVCMMAWVTNPVTFQPSLLGIVVVHAASDPPCVGPGGT